MNARYIIFDCSTSLELENLQTNMEEMISEVREKSSQSPKKKSLYWITCMINFDEIYNCGNFFGGGDFNGNTHRMCGFCAHCLN